MWSWDGADWSYVAGSDYWEIFRNGPSTMSCSGVDDCIAVGPNVFETAPTSAAWDGSVWSEVPVPAGVTSTADVECVSKDQCLMLVASGSTVGALAWMGGWTWAPAPPAGSGGTSCLPQWCMNVGRTGTPSSPTAATYEWTNP